MNRVRVEKVTRDQATGRVKSSQFTPIKVCCPPCPPGYHIQYDFDYVCEEEGEGTADRNRVDNE